MHYFGQVSLGLFAAIAPPNVLASEHFDWSYPPMWYFLSQRWFLGPLMIVLLTMLVVAVIRSDQKDRKKRHRVNRQTPLEILKERFARGEIDANEFEERKEILSR